MRQSDRTARSSRSSGATRRLTSRPWFAGPVDTRSYERSRAHQPSSRAGSTGPGSGALGRRRQDPLRKLGFRTTAAYARGTHDRGRPGGEGGALRARSRTERAHPPDRRHEPRRPVPVHVRVRVRLLGGGSADAARVRRRRPRHRFQGGTRDDRTRTAAAGPPAERRSTGAGVPYTSPSRGHRQGPGGAGVGTLMAADASGRRELLARLLDESTDALFALDGNGAILFANAAAAALVAQERSYLLGKPFPALVAFDDRRDFRRLVSSLTAQEPCRSMTIRLTSDGTSWSVAVRRLGREGGPFAVRIVDSKAAADIANKRAVGIEVERTLLRLPQAILGVAADGTVAFANERARRLLGEAQLRRGRPLRDEPDGVPLGLLVDRLLGGP